MYIAAAAAQRRRHGAAIVCNDHRECPRGFHPEVHPHLNRQQVILPWRRRLLAGPTAFLSTALGRALQARARRQQSLPGHTVAPAAPCRSGALREAAALCIARRRGRLSTAWTRRHAAGTTQPRKPSGWLGGLHRDRMRAGTAEQLCTSAAKKEGPSWVTIQGAGCHLHQGRACSCSRVSGARPG